MQGYNNQHFAQYFFDFEFDPELIRNSIRSDFWAKEILLILIRFCAISSFIGNSRYFDFPYTFAILTLIRNWSGFDLECQYFQFFSKYFWRRLIILMWIFPILIGTWNPSIKIYQFDISKKQQAYQNLRFWAWSGFDFRCEFGGPVFFVQMFLMIFDANFFGTSGRFLLHFSWSGISENFWCKICWTGWIFEANFPGQMLLPRLLLPQTTTTYYYHILLPRTTTTYYYHILLPHYYYYPILLPHTTTPYYYPILLPHTTTTYYYPILLPTPQTTTPILL